MPLHFTFRKSLALLFLALCTTAGAATWTPTQGVAGLTTQLRSVWSADANNAWAVSGGTSTSQIAYWDGSTWTLQASPVAKGLYSVWGTATNSIWVGGRDGTMLFYNGTSWTVQNSTLGAGWFIYDLWGTDANNVWAVASDGSTGRVLKWGGSSWSVIHSSANGLHSIWGTSATNIWVVGISGFVENFNNNTWTTYSTGLAATMFGVWGADANNVWIVGGSGLPTEHSALFKWNGTSLSPFTTTGLPVASTTNSFRAVMGSSVNNIYIVGDGPGGFVSRWDGTTWATEAASSSGGSYSNCWSNPAATDLWVVGAPGLVARGTAAASVIAPTVNTPTSSSVTYNSATLGGSISATGGANATARGLVYALTSQNPNPEIGGSNVTVLTDSGSFGMGAFTLGATSLAGSSAYSYKAYATNPGGTGYSSVSTFNTPAAPAPEIAVSFNGNNVADDSSTVSAVNGTDFGSTPVNGGQVDRTFTITNSGTAVLTVTSLAVTGDFSVTAAPSNNVGLGGTTTFTIRFDPTAQGARSGTVSFTTNDGDEASYNFAVQGDGMAPQTFDLAGRPLSNAPFDGGQTYIFGVPEPVDSTLGDVVSSGGAPGTNGSSEIGTFNVLRRGAFLAENGFLAFPGTLQEGSGTPAVTAATSAGLWKTAGGNLFLLARTGTTVPEVTSGQFASLPEVPGLSDAGDVSFLGTLVVGQGGVTADNDTGIWSELGGTGLALVMREDEDVPGRAGVKVGKFASGLYATATIDGTTGEAVFPVTYRGASTKTAILRASVTGSTVAVSVVAEEGVAAPGAGANFGNIAGSFSDPGRMDAQGNYVFAALTSVGSKEGIWYQARGTGAPTKVFYAGETAPNTGGATFARLQRPAIGGSGYVAFRASLNANGDNAAGTRNDGIWAGVASNPAGFTCILRRGDGQSVVSNLPAGSLVGNPWGGWLTNSNRGAWRAWLDVNGDGTSAAPTDVHAIYTNLSGSMQLAVRAGDAAAGTTGAVFKGIDLPVVGGSNQYAFLGTLESGDTVTGNNQGLWKSGPNGGSLLLVLRKGDVMTTTEGGKTISKVDLPGSNQTDRQWEQPVMDATGKMVVNVTFTDGSSSQILVP